MFFTGLANDLQDVDKKTHRPTKLISQGKQVGYFYDKHGRVKTKTLVPIDKNGNEIPQSTHNLVGYRESLQLFYSPNHELIKSITIKDEGLKVVKTVTHYYYDAFGRRIGKSSSTQKSSKLNQRGELVRFPSNLSSLNTTDRPQRKNTLMLWDGNQQIQEYTDEQIFTTVYEQGSFEPVARVVQLANHIEQKRLADIAYETRRFVRIGESEETINQRIADNSKPLINIYHYHCNHLGTPQELTSQDGDVVWLSYDRAWGGSFETIYKPQFIDNYALQESELQPIKFQGQSLDTETGLHYNRFRYYDSDVGMFISRDPIGLLGGNNVFQYAPNPVGWIDPYGLAKARDCTGMTRAEKEKLVSKRPNRRRKGVVDKVWENAKDENGRVFDPNTGEELFWDKSKKRDKQWDMGHMGKTHEEFKQDFIEGRITYQDYLDEYNKVENYKPQAVGPNRSRRYD